jgi:hypothetical protein
VEVASCLEISERNLSLIIILLFGHLFSAAGREDEIWFWRALIFLTVPGNKAQLTLLARGPLALRLFYPVLDAF